MSPLKKIDPHITFAGAVSGIVIWAFTTFATVKYVDAKHDEVAKLLVRIEKKLDRMDERLWLLSGHGPKPNSVHED